MANTVIQLKWSDVTSAPATLNVGEAAYSNTSNKFFIGDTAGNVLTIGGKFYVDQQGQIFTKTNVAFDTANSAASYANAAFASSNNNAGAAIAGSYANSAFGVANSASSYANSGFAAANTADAKAVSAGVYGNSAFAAANTADSKATSAGSYANSAFSSANTADSKATSAGSYANSGFAVANSAATYANSGFAVANAASSYANSAYTRANNSINANTGGTISGDLSITGNLSVLGNNFIVSTSQIVANDTMFILGQGNYTSDILDIGFAAHYNGGTNAHTGLIRDSGTKEWQLFEGYTPEIGANNQIDINDASFKIATLNANLHSTVVLVNGIDLLPYVNNAYAAANTADTKAVNSGSYANSAFLQANTPSYVSNSASSYANSAFSIGNSAFSAANSAGTYANSAFAAANTADSKATSAGSYANSGFAVANSGASYANSGFAVANSAASYGNSAFAKANTDFTNISISSTDYGSASIVPTFHVAANGRIDAITNVTIAIAASQITSGTLGVARGGTGAGTFTTNAVLLGNGTSAFNTASSSTEGHLLTINASGVPTFAMLSGGTF